MSIPAQIREQLHIRPGQRLVWEQVSDSECRVIAELREGDA